MRPFRYYVLNRDPPVLSYLGVDSIKTEGGIPPLPPDIGPLTLLEHPLSWRGDRDQMQRVAAMQTRLDQVNISHHLMVNSGDENELRIECDVRGGMFSQNIFVNENIFQPETARKRYDAVHIAGMYPVKRHQLASGIEKLYVITYGGGDLHTFCPQIAHAEFNRHYLEPEEVADIINAAHAGLCLSAVEGAMFASMEYLMCGVPVVTTPSKGGRDEFFDHTNCIVVEPNAGAVKVGVERWKQEAPEPAPIRADVMCRVHTVRREFCEYVADIVQKNSHRSVCADNLFRLYYSADGIYARAIAVDVFTSASLQHFKFDDNNTVPQKSPGARESEGNGSLRLESVTGVEMGCDLHGAIIWRLCDGNAGVHDIVTTIVDAYGVDRSTVEAQVRLFLTRLHQHELLI